MPKAKPHVSAIPSGDQVALIPQDFALACEQFGAERLMRRMMRDPILGLAFTILCSLVLEGEHRIVPAISDLPDTATPEELRRQTLAEEIAAFHRRWIEEMDRPLLRTLFYAMEAVPYGHKLCEVETALDADGRLRPIDVAPKPRTAYTLSVDKSNRLIDVRANGSATDPVLPRSVFLFSLAGRDDHPSGYPALERAYEAWYRKGCAKPIETRSLAAFAGGLNWAEAGSEASDLVDTIVDGVQKTVPAADVVARAAASLKTGVTAAFPKGWSLRTLQPATSYGAFDSVYDRCDREMAASIFIVARAIQEAQFGSKADSQTAEGLVSSIKDWIRGELCAAIKSQLLMVATLDNWGPEARDLCPSYSIVTDERSEMTAVASAVTSFDSVGALTPELVDYLLSMVGVPTAVRRSVMEAIEGKPEPERQQTQFADTPPTVPAKKAAGIDRKAKSIVSRYDRSFRSLTSRWLNGKIDADKFAERFSALLASGHDEAARYGARLAGHRGRTLPADVLASLASTIATESEFLSDLISEVEDGSRTVAEANLAARRYAIRMSGTMSAAFHEASPEDAVFWWRLGGAEQHCQDCPRLAELSPMTKDEVFTRPREGETQCQCGCKCRLVRDDGATAPGPTDLGGYE